MTHEQILEFLTSKDQPGLVNAQSEFFKTLYQRILAFQESARRDHGPTCVCSACGRGPETPFPKVMDDGPVALDFDEPAEPVLCYIGGNTAYFTSLPLDQQWGDGWGKISYQNDAGSPYTWTHNAPIGCHGPVPNPSFTITEVVFSNAGFTTPRETIATISVQAINAGGTPWLTEEYPPRTRPAVRIMAGTTVSEFKRLVRLAGGSVFVFEPAP